jgi:hypothetical protein
MRIATRQGVQVHCFKIRVESAPGFIACRFQTLLSILTDASTLGQLNAVSAAVAGENLEAFKSALPATAEWCKLTDSIKTQHISAPGFNASSHSPNSLLQHK